MSVPYLAHIAVIFAIQSILVGGFSFLFGGAGIANLAHIATAAIGAYASAILAVRFGWTLALTLPAAAALGVAFGLTLALLLRRVRGDYLALVALQVHLVVTIILLNWTSLTRGALGIPGIPRLPILHDPARYLLLAGGLAIGILVTLWVILRSPYGRAMGAIRDDETAAAVLGKRVPNVRTITYLVAAATGATGGALLAHYIQFIDPLTFPIHLLAMVIAGAIVGGVGSIPGAIVGTAIVVLIPEVLRFLVTSPAYVGPLRQIIFALIILLVLLLRPRGLFGKVDVR